MLNCYCNCKIVCVIKRANIAPKAIPHIKKKLIQDPDFPIKFSGTSLGAKEKTTVVLNPFERANKAICTNIIIPNKFL